MHISLISLPREDVAMAGGWKEGGWLLQLPEAFLTDTGGPAFVGSCRVWGSWRTDSLKA